MVRITNKGLLIEIETSSPHELLYYLQQSLLQILKDASDEYNDLHNPKPALYDLLQNITPDTLQLTRGI